MSVVKPVAWITHPACSRHDMGAGHPESSSRIAAIEDRLIASGLMDFMVRESAPEAEQEQLLRVHSRRLVDWMLSGHHEGEARVIDGDTVFMQHSKPAALRATGAAVRAVDMMLSDRAGLAFCAVRPPGHHAERDRAMGFCLFNNVAVGAAHALANGIERVAVLDFDLHYGNGTADIFLDDPRVWLYSTYQHPLYPQWAGAPRSPHLIDVPLAARSGSKAFRTAVTTFWLPALERQQPELILVSAGFDAHAQDPLGDLRLGYDDFRWIGTVIRDVAAQFCQGRVVATLEGGYDLHALARSVEFFLQPFLGL
ncbi:acetoin utilization deacetylase AcuC-like enzyme [Panacagrimonas perspica]|uniref:Acetoin utilization deacetylase AcuC-like enzyme n=1 Tax=Panacagrimonas perspica TaxID=381431 RepID=A0A4R7PEF5_9GAMM|nr:histone deacetylase family protein [Panacagrimonas perspica]TDU31670.1 acetoin utilization deacetylase AcuC-like enzyme [Panacagrimonas perspica]THD03113.1 deacetylase [Panacagrimonas perspica]